MNIIKQIVLTGGPCSGKTTAQNFLQEKLSNWGWLPIFSHESATLIITGGARDIADLRKNNSPHYLDVQRQIILLQRDLRRRFEALARAYPDEKKVIFHDRAELDARAYMTEEQFWSVCEEEHLTGKDLYDPYTAVIHLVTAANGAEEFYTLENNSARYETPEEARVADARTLEAWNGHPHIKIIDNSTDFEGKMRRALAAVARTLEIPAPLEIERKFLLNQLVPLEKHVPVERVFIEQMYLSSSDPATQVRIRRRTHRGFSSYYLTTKRNLRSGVRHEVEEHITPTEYLRLQNIRDLERQIVQKHRYCFSYKNQYFEFDDFISEPLQLLEIELTEENDRVEIPPFCAPFVVREVTDDSAYSNYEIARKKPR